MTRPYKNSVSRSQDIYKEIGN